MLKEQAKILNRASVLLDLLVILAAFFFAYEIRDNYEKGLREVRFYLWSLFLILPIWYYLLTRVRLFSSIRRLSTFDLFTRLFNVHLAGGVIVASIIYYVDRDKYSRGFLLVFLLCSFAFLLIEKILLRYTLGFFRRRGYNVRNLVIVGTREKARRFLQLLRAHSDWGLNLLGFVRVTDAPLGEDFQDQVILGEVCDLIEICKSLPVDEVVFCVPKDYVVDVEEYLKKLEELGTSVSIVLDIFNISFYRKEVSLFHNDIPMLTFHAKEFDAQQLLIKRLFDILGSIVGLFITMLLFPFIAVAIKLDSRGPLFFGQKRVGQSGRIFNCWKFRSMYEDAEQRKAELLKDNEVSGAMFKLSNDPRVTKVGRFLRKTSLDEFPQFWNVFVGQMSLVGTRPPTPDEVAEYDNWQHRRISITPGITGLWQVSGRSEINDFDKVVELDLSYIDNWSLWLDIKILLKTIYVVLSRKGSH